MVHLFLFVLYWENWDKCVHNVYKQGRKWRQKEFSLKLVYAMLKEMTLPSNALLAFILLEDTY